MPAICHQLAQDARQGLQILVLELMDGLAQWAAMNRERSEPIELERGNLAASTDHSTSVICLRQATASADRRFDRLDLPQTVCAQPGTEALAGCAVRWKQQIES